MDFHHALAWLGFLALVGLLLGFDLFVVHRTAHAIRLREALIGTLLPIAAAAFFAALLYFAYDRHWLDLGQIPPGTPAAEQQYYPDTGPQAVLLFITGYLVELSLSADNVFLFVVLMTFFAVPARLQHRVLFWGVLGALAMRAVMILVGAAVLHRFAWIIYVFGAFLLIQGIRMFFSDGEHKDPSQSAAVRLARAFLPIHPDYDGDKFFTRINGKRFATTLFLVVAAIEITDLIFALDSIPAIFGITKDPFIVFTSNIFAILGLRSMYFLLAGVMNKFHLLRYGLSFVLAFVGFKMILPGLGAAYGKLVAGQEVRWHLPSTLSLAIILSALVISITASLLFPRRSANAPTPPSNPAPGPSN